MTEYKFNPHDIAVLLPGQASQEQGMGVAAAEASEKALRIFEVGSYIAGIDLLTYNRETETKDMTGPVVQPALGAAILANLELAKELGLDPRLFIGKSVSEILAMSAANVFGLEDTFRILTVRGLAMDEANKHSESSMAAFIGPNRHYFEWLTKLPGVSPGILNARFQNVASGHPQALERMEKLARRIDQLSGSAKAHFDFDLSSVKSRAKTLVTTVKGDGGSHSDNMATAVERVVSEAERAEKQSPDTPVILNDAQFLSHDTSTYAPYLGNALVTTAYWEDSIWTALDSNVRLFVEVDAGEKGFVSKDIKNDFPDHTIIDMPFGEVIQINFVPEEHRPPARKAA
jgi:[acyl-carrier-protein] S-malonyltransferase